jgi:hypothetical protein
VRVPVRPDGTGGQKTQVQLIDLGTKKAVKVFDDFESEKLPVVALAFDTDGRKLLAGTGLLTPDEVPAATPKGEVKLFDLTAGRKP